MKPVLYWTFVRPGFSRNWTVLGVTSEGPRGRINGRYEDGATTHTTIRECRGKFETLDAIKERKVAMDEVALRLCVP